MPASSARHPDRHYLGVAPVSYDEAGNPKVEKQHLRFAPEFGGQGATMNGPSSDFGRRRKKRKKRGPKAQQVTPRMAKPKRSRRGGKVNRAKLDRVQLKRGAFVVSVVAPNAQAASDKAAVLFRLAGANVATPFAVSAAGRNANRRPVWTVRAVPHATAVNAAMSGFGSNPDGDVDGDLSSTFGAAKKPLKPLSPEDAKRYLGKDLKGSHYKRGSNFVVNLVAPNPLEAKKVALSVARAAKVSVQTGTEKVKGIGTIPGPPLPFPPFVAILPVWQVSIALPATASAPPPAKEEEAPKARGRRRRRGGRRRRRGGRGGGGGGDAYQRASRQHEASTQQRYDRAVEALLADSFGSNPDGDVDGDLSSTFGLNDYDDFGRDDGLGGCGCR